MVAPIRVPICMCGLPLDIIGNIQDTMIGGTTIMPHPNGLNIVMDGRTTDHEEISEVWVAEEMVVIGGDTGKKYVELSNCK